MIEIEDIQKHLDEFEKVQLLFMNRGITRSSALVAYIGMKMIDAIECINMEWCDPPDDNDWTPATD